MQELPTTGNDRRIARDQPEQVEDRGRIGRREILDPAEERRVPHLDGDEQHLVEREEHRDLDHDRQAAGDRIDLLLLVELHQRLLLLHLVVAVALADRHHLRLHRLHLRHRGVGLVGEREEHDLDEHGDDQDGDAEIADLVVDPVHRQEQRLGDEVEPAPVDQQVELVELELLVVAVDDADLLGAGEQARFGGAGRARRDRARGAQIVGLIGLGAADLVRQELGVDLSRGIGDQRRGPVLVGDAEPAPWWPGTASVLLLLDLRVGDSCQALLAEHADQALVQDVVALRLRRAVARDQRVGIERDRRRRRCW